MKIKTFNALSTNGLDNKVNDFIRSNEITVLKIHFSSSFNGLAALIEYEDKWQPTKYNGV